MDRKHNEPIEASKNSIANFKKQMEEKKSKDQPTSQENHIEDKSGLNETQNLNKRKKSHNFKPLIWILGICAIIVLAFFLIIKPLTEKSDAERAELAAMRQAQQEALQRAEELQRQQEAQRKADEAEAKKAQEEYERYLETPKGKYANMGYTYMGTITPYEYNDWSDCKIWSEVGGLYELFSISNGSTTRYVVVKVNNSYGKESIVEECNVTSCSKSAKIDDCYGNSRMTMNKTFTCGYDDLYFKL